MLSYIFLKHCFIHFTLPILKATNYLYIAYFVPMKFINFNLATKEIYIHYRHFPKE